MAAPGSLQFGSKLFKSCNRFTNNYAYRNIHSSNFNHLKILSSGRQSLNRLAIGSAGIASIYLGVKLFRSSSASVLQASTKALPQEQQHSSGLQLSSSSSFTSDGKSSTSVPWHFTNPPTKQVINRKDGKPVTLTLYQYATCPFCCKVRVYLDYFGLNYNIVEVDSIRRTQKKWTSYKKVPILVCDGIGGDKGFLQLNDSAMIVSLLECQRLNAAQGDLKKLMSFYPVIETKKGKKRVLEYPNKYFLMYEDKVPDRGFAELREEREWREWVDNNLVHTLSPNVYRTLSESFKTFQWFSEAGDWENCMSTVSRYSCVYMGSLVMWVIGARLKRRYGLEDDVRQSLYKSVNEWMDGIGPSRKFMGGDKPNLADLAVYGVMSAIEGCQAFNDLSQHTKFMNWYSPMKKAVKRNGGLVSVSS